jgi:hypothetical protein
LSSVELETLVAKLFEAAGCFVAAYRGGCIKHVDLFAHNDGARTIKLGKLELLPKRTYTIQVKLKLQARLKKCPDEVDCLIALDAPKQPNCYDANWLLEQVKRCPEVRRWLKRSLRWLQPTGFLTKCGLRG